MSTSILHIKHKDFGEGRESSNFAEPNDINDLKTNHQMHTTIK